MARPHRITTDRLLGGAIEVFLFFFFLGGGGGVEAGSDWTEDLIRPWHLIVHIKISVDLIRSLR